MANVFDFAPVDIHGNNKNRKRVVIMTCKDGRICRFPSVREAARLMDIPAPSIIACLKGRLETAGGYRWKYADDFCSYGERREND